MIGLLPEQMRLDRIGASGFANGVIRLSLECPAMEVLNRCGVSC